MVLWCEFFSGWISGRIISLLHYMYCLNFFLAMDNNCAVIIFTRNGRSTCRSPHWHDKSSTANWHAQYSQHRKICSSSRRNTRWDLFLKINYLVLNPSYPSNELVQHFSVVWEYLYFPTALRIPSTLASTVDLWIRLSNGDGSKRTYRILR